MEEVPESGYVSPSQRANVTQGWDEDNGVLVNRTEFIKEVSTSSAGRLGMDGATRVQQVLLLRTKKRRENGKEVQAHGDVRNIT